MRSAYNLLLGAVLVLLMIAAVPAQDRLPGNAPATFTVHSFKASNGQTLRYSLFVPKDLPQDARLPLVVCLHGSGGGTHAATVLSSPEQQKKRPCFLMAPACDGKGDRWVKAEFRGGKGRAVEPELMEALDAVVRKHPIDRTRIDLTGQSMGGVGTWGLVAAHPQRFAAAVPVCGLGDPADAKKMMEVPIWAFHGAKDNAAGVLLGGDAAGPRLTYTNMIHTRALLGKGFDRRFKSFENALKNVPELSTANKGWRQVRQPPSHAELEQLWADDRAVLIGKKE